MKYFFGRISLLEKTVKHYTNLLLALPFPVCLLTFPPLSTLLLHNHNFGRAYKTHISHGLVPTNIKVPGSFQFIVNSISPQSPCSMFWCRLLLSIHIELRWVRRLILRAVEEQFRRQADETTPEEGDGDGEGEGHVIKVKGLLLLLQAALQDRGKERKHDFKITCGSMVMM